MAAANSRPVEIVYFGGDNELPFWFIQVLNTGQKYRFLGLDEEDQQQSIIYFSRLVQGGDAEKLAASIGDVIKIPEGTDGASAVNALFANTDCMMMSGDPVYPEDGSAAADALIDLLEEVGEALGEFIAKLGWVLV